MTATSLAMIAFLGLAGLIEVGLRMLQLAAALASIASRPAPPIDPAPRHGGVAQFVSVHMPTHDEPPELVIASLQALARSRCDRFEVIVVDNNTPDVASWRPLQIACDTLGSRFRFMHVDGLAGAKAGALNVALAHADPQTTHVAVVDADYQVHPDFLRDGLRALAQTRADYVQFPQAYRDVAGSARGVEHELGDYFASFEGGAGRPGSMLPTGTLSLFTLHALKAVGGWPTGTITEDAEIGVQLQRCGCQGLWLAHERGRGLLPVDFRGLAVQRARWAAGNLQVLKGLFTRWPGLTIGEFVILTIQLTSWLSLWAPLSAALALAVLAPAMPYAQAIARLAASAILISAVLTWMRMMLSSGGRRVGWRAGLGAMVAKIALAWTSAIAWLPALSPRRLVFVRTRKLLGPVGDGGLAPLAAISLGFLLLAGLYAVRGEALEAAACALLASSWACAKIVDAGLRKAARGNPELLAEPA